MKTLQDLLQTEVRKYPGAFSFKEQVPLIYCMDGTTLSVQTGQNLYCSPREDYGPWTAVEVGFPSRGFAQLMPYIDGDEDTDPTQTVYGYVPIHIVEEVIESCGGICWEVTLIKHHARAD